MKKRIGGFEPSVINITPNPVDHEAYWLITGEAAGRLRTFRARWDGTGLRDLS